MIDPKNPVTGPITNVKKYYSPNGAVQYIDSEDEKFGDDRKVFITNSSGEVVEIK